MNVSNHAIGSPRLRLSTVADFDGDGVADLAIPSLDRRTLRFLSFRGGTLKEIAAKPLPAPATTDFAQVGSTGKPAVQVGHDGGRTSRISP
jgi:hypothetical protein